MRLELQAQHTHVAAIYSSAVESDRSRNTPGAKVTAKANGLERLAALERGETEIDPDPKAREVRDAVARDPALFEAALRSRI